jgi:ribosomal protein S18 acetylase RimI-like enzyme
MKFEPYRPSLGAALARLWNRSFGGRRHFVPLTPRLFRDRIEARREFDPEDLIVAREGRELAGFVHVGRRSEGACRRACPDWPGGVQGFVAFLVVDPERRRRGLGTELWHRGIERLRGTRQVVLPAPEENFFYGAPAGLPPLWGTPWGVAVPWEDAGTRKFLAGKGYGPRSRALQVALSVESGGAPVERFPSAGKVRRLASGGTSLAYYGWGPEPLFGILGFQGVDWKARRSAWVARSLLRAALDRAAREGVRACEALVEPELRPREHALYVEAGFRPVAAWAIYGSAGGAHLLGGPKQDRGRRVK